MTEILAPAGSRDALMAAIRGGADAVYLGLSRFNARRNADNFTDDELPSLVSYCHSRGVKVHITLNTLLEDSELEDAFETAALCARSGVDAVIIQDLGLFSLIHRAIPDMPLHASTQLSLHNAAGVRFAQAAGFSRAVLAREMSREEIAAAAEGAHGMETEAFVHGALCMSVSGQCYISALLGGRSGNRGLCAQACRLPFICNGREYALSLKDLSLTRYLGDFPADSAKIEGRMKRPEYVAAASHICRKAVSGEKVTEEEISLLRDVFSRSGFTDGYYTAKRDVNMFGHRRREDTENTSAAFGKINEMTRREPQRLGVRMSFTARSGEKISLIASDADSGYEVRVTGEIPAAAEHVGTSEEKIKDNLAKTGNTPFFAQNISVTSDEMLAIPLSAVNALRREALEKLAEERGRTVSYAASLPEYRSVKDEPEGGFRYRFEKYSQIPLKALGEGSSIVLPIAEIDKYPEITRMGYRVFAELPRLIFGKGGEERILSMIKRTGVRDVVCGNVGALQLALDAGVTPHGDFGLNIMNGETFAFFYGKGLESAVLSFEMTLRQIRKTARRGTGIIVYGKLPLMLTRECIKAPDGGCARCDGSNFTITDRKGESFDVLCRRGYNEVLNCRVLWLADRLNELEGTGFCELYFTDETAAQAADVIEKYHTGGEAAGLFTRGLYYRGVM